MGLAITTRITGFLYIGLLFLGIGTDCPAQEVQWASEVISVSSQIGTKEYSAKQVLGKPNKCPAAGDSPCAWYGKSDGFFGGREEHIKVGYKKPMQIQQVAIAENFNPGAVEKVILYDVQNNAHTVYHGEAAPVNKQSRVMNVTFLKTDYKVKAVELVLQCGKVPGLNEIDAIGIANTRIPVVAEINVAPNAKIEGVKENLGSGVNSPYEEVYPIISPDGQTLYFDRKDHPSNIGRNDNIWFSELTPAGKWGPAKIIGRELNNGYGSFAASITPDGNTLLLGGVFVDSGRQQFGIWTSRKLAVGWATPTHVRIDSYYTRNRFMEFCLAADGKTLLISLQRDDSRGERDLYSCFMRPDGSWTAPKSLGPEINSAADEGTPFLAADGKTLYFASDGFSGYGSTDMFLSRRLDDTWQHWSEPENLGPDFNTPDWDAYFTIPASGDYAYFVSRQGAIGEADVFRAKLPASLQPSAVVLVMGKVIDAKTGKPLEATIHYEVLPGGKEAGIAHSNPVTGQYKISLPSGALYGFRAEANGYLAVNENLDVKKLDAYAEIKRDLKLVPAEVGQTVRLNNLFFDFNKSELKSESFAELDRLVELLKASPKMEVEIVGHTDNVGNDATNKKLSNDRAIAVRNYLVSKAIAAKRLKTIGYGSSKPLASNETEEGRQQNRRVEF
ncbi:MAG: OmpA family protein, partial [Bacteroidota bacterium]|nr:OmpA family protein [Bacteroidota bacterium]